MPFYEYRPKSGECAKCDGCFVDLQKMSDAAHSSCPDCGQECERVISAPMVSVRGSDYKSASNAEKRAETMARISGGRAPLRDSKTGSLKSASGQHDHDCAKHGCLGETTARRYGLLPHLVGSDKEKS